MKDVIVELGLSLVVLATDLAFGYPVDDLPYKSTLGILAFLVMPVQLPSRDKLLLTLLALVVPSRIIRSPLA